MEHFNSIVGTEAQGGMRLDRYVSEVLKLLSRSQVKARNMTATVNGKPVKVSRIVEPGDLIDLSWNSPEPTDLIPEEIPFNVLYEDERVIVINKPQGMVVHPGAGNRQGTMATGILYRRNKKFRAEVEPPAPYDPTLNGTATIICGDGPAAAAAGTSRRRGPIASARCHPPPAAGRPRTEPERRARSSCASSPVTASSTWTATTS